MKALHMSENSLPALRARASGTAGSTEKAPARRRRKGNGQTHLTRDELERMLLAAARWRAANSWRSR
jgi:hypothetical protein